MSEGDIKQTLARLKDSEVKDKLKQTTTELFDCKVVQLHIFITLFNKITLDL